MENEIVNLGEKVCHLKEQGEKLREETDCDQNAFKDPVLKIEQK